VFKYFHPCHKIRRLLQPPGLEWGFSRVDFATNADGVHAVMDIVLRPDFPLDVPDDVVYCHVLRRVGDAAPNDSKNSNAKQKQRPFEDLNGLRRGWEDEQRISFTPAGAIACVCEYVRVRVRE
jgi:hypothetical protein